MAYYACSTNGDYTPDEWVTKDDVWNLHGGQVRWNSVTPRTLPDEDLNIDPDLEDLLH